MGLDLDEALKWYEEVPRDNAYVGKCTMRLPKKLRGMTVLDIGCRSGKGVFKLSEKVGANGMAIGVDWGADFIKRAFADEKANTKKLGYKKPNTDFRLGIPENLKPCGFPDECIDFVYINSVFNLLYDKELVLREIFRILKPGGMLNLDIVVADRAIPEVVMQDEARDGDAVGAAMTAVALDHLLVEAGFSGIAHPETEVLALADRPQSKEHDDVLSKIPFTETLVSALR